MFGTEEKLWSVDLSRIYGKYFAPGCFEEKGDKNNGSLEERMLRTNAGSHHTKPPPFQKLVFKSSLLQKWLVRHSSTVYIQFIHTSPDQQHHLCLPSVFILLLWCTQGKEDKVYTRQRRPSFLAGSSQSSQLPPQSQHCLLSSTSTPVAANFLLSWRTVMGIRIVLLRIWIKSCGSTLKWCGSGFSVKPFPGAIFRHFSR